MIQDSRLTPIDDYNFSSLNTYDLDAEDFKDSFAEGLAHGTTNTDPYDIGRFELDDVISTYLNGVDAAADPYASLTDFDNI